jgi:hypothetical protein
VPGRCGLRGVGTRNRIVQVTSLLTCAIWIASLAVIIDPEPAGFRTDPYNEATTLADSDVEDDIRTGSASESASGSETIAVLLSDGSFATSPATDPPSSRLSLRFRGVVPLPSAISTQIATTVLRP